MSVERGIGPNLTSWRLRPQRYSLVGESCSHCQAKIFPPRDICPECNHETKELYKFSGRGEVYSYTTVHDPPAGFEEGAPYTIALVRLEEGPLLTAQLTDLGENAVEIGMPVEMVIRKLSQDGERGMLIYGYKFRPRLDSSEKEAALLPLENSLSGS